MTRVDAQGKRSAGNADDVKELRRVYAEWGRGNFRPRPDVYADDMEWGWSDEFPGLERVSHDPNLRSSHRRALEVIGRERGNPQRRESEQWHSRS